MKLAPAPQIVCGSKSYRLPSEINKKEDVELEKQVNVNEKIRAPEVRVIGREGQQLGVIPIRKALELAALDELDLVEVAPNAEPPVCKIMDYGKFKYQQSKRTQEAKKKQTVIQVKEVKIRPKTDEHDLQTKIKHIKRFLAQRDKAKVTILFRGREIAYADQGMKVLERIQQELKDEVVVEQAPRMEGRNMIMILAPK
ncbi:MAG: translation initiation factor IF-3 [Syntrophobacteraceae bacterium]